MNNLICGHPPRDPDEMTTGTGHFHDREICYDCMEKVELFYCGLETTYSAYVDGDAKSITTWTGGHLMQVTEFRKIRHNMSGEMHYIRAIDTLGNVWSGRGLGQGMNINMRRRAE